MRTVSDFKNLNPLILEALKHDRTTLAEAGELPAFDRAVLELEREHLPKEPPRLVAPNGTPHRTRAFENVVELMLDTRLAELPKDTLPMLSIDGQRKLFNVPAGTSQLDQFAALLYWERCMPPRRELNADTVLQQAVSYFALHLQEFDVLYSRFVNCEALAPVPVAPVAPVAPKQPTAFDRAVTAVMNTTAASYAGALGEAAEQWLWSNPNQANTIVQRAQLLADYEGLQAGAEVDVTVESASEFAALASRGLARFIGLTPAPIPVPKAPARGDDGRFVPYHGSEMSCGYNAC